MTKKTAHSVVQIIASKRGKVSEQENCKDTFAKIVEVTSNQQNALEN